MSLISEIKARASEFLRTIPDGAKEQNAFEDFLKAVGNDVRHAFREEWLSRDKATRDEKKDEFKILGE